MNLSIRSAVSAIKTTIARFSVATALVAVSLTAPMIISSTAAADDTQPVCVAAPQASAAFPTAPTLISPSNDGTNANGFDFSWTSVNGAVSYDWESSYIAETDTSGYFIRPVATHNLSDTSINEGGSHSGVYYWHVRAVNADGQHGYWSPTWMVIINSNSTVSDNLSAPSLVSPDDNATCNIHTDDFNFIWNVPEYGTGLGVTYVFQSGYTSETDPLTGEFINHPWTDYGLQDTMISDGNSASGTYYWHVRAVSADGQTLGPWSETRVVTIVRNAPVEPTDPVTTTPESTNPTNTPSTTTSASVTTPAATPAVVRATKLAQLQPVVADTVPAQSGTVLAATTTQNQPQHVNVATSAVTIKANWMARNGIWLITILLALSGSTLIYQAVQKFRATK